MSFTYSFGTIDLRYNDATEIFLIFQILDAILPIIKTFDYLENH